MHVHARLQFDEVLLFSGKIQDYKRRHAEAVGMLKCKVNLFMKEDETINGMSKKYPDREPIYYEVARRALHVCLLSDPSCVSRCP